MFSAVCFASAPARLEQIPGYLVRTGACSDHFLAVADAAAEAAGAAEAAADPAAAAALRRLARDATTLAPRYAARPLPRQ